MTSTTSDTRNQDLSRKLQLAGVHLLERFEEMANDISSPSVRDIGAPSGGQRGSQHREHRSRRLDLCRGSDLDSGKRTLRLETGNPATVLGL